MKVEFTFDDSEILTGSVTVDLDGLRELHSGSSDTDPTTKESPTVTLEEAGVHESCELHAVDLPSDANVSTCGGDNPAVDQIPPRVFATDEITDWIPVCEDCKQGLMEQYG